MIEENLKIFKKLYGNTLQNVDSKHHDDFVRYIHGEKVSNDFLGYIAINQKVGQLAQDILEEQAKVRVEQYKIKKGQLENLVEPSETVLEKTKRFFSRNEYLIYSISWTISAGIIAYPKAEADFKESLANVLASVTLAFGAGLFYKKHISKK